MLCYVRNQKLNQNQLVSQKERNHNNNKTTKFSNSCKFKIDNLTNLHFTIFSTLEQKSRCKQIISHTFNVWTGSNFGDAVTNTDTPNIHGENKLPQAALAQPVSDKPQCTSLFVRSFQYLKSYFFLIFKNLYLVLTKSKRISYIKTLIQ